MEETSNLKFQIQDLRLVKGRTIRNTKNQKKKFIKYIKDKIDGDFPVTEDTFLGGVNVIIGNLENAKYIVTAHYDTPKRNLFNDRIPKNALNKLRKLNIYKSAFCMFSYISIMVIILLLCIFAFVVFKESVTNMYVYIFLDNFENTFMFLCLIISIGILPILNNTNNDIDNTSGVLTALNYLYGNKHNSNVCCVLFDQEETGLKGSKAFFDKYKESLKNKYLINCDCVAEGDSIIIWNKGLIDEATNEMQDLQKQLITSDEPRLKSINLVPKGYGIATDFVHFEKGCSIMRCYNKNGKYTYKKIHSTKDKADDDIEYMRDIEICIDLIQQLIENNESKM